MAGNTVFVVDADSETEKIIVSTLESEGYLVFAVPGADVGAEIAQKVKPSLIFVNPGDTSEKGMAVCRTIRGYEALKNAPIILLVSRPGGADLGSYGIVDSLLLPLSSAELLEKTEKAFAAKAPVVLRIKEKALAQKEDKVPEAGPAALEDLKDAGGKSRLWDLSEVAGMEEEEESHAAPQKDWEEDVAYMPEEETGSGLKNKKLLVALLAILVVVAGVAGAVYYSGLMPGMGPQVKVPVPQTMVQKPKALQPAPVAVTQQPASDKPATAPSAAPSLPAKEDKTAAKAYPVPTPEKSATTSKSPGKTVYSVQVGVFKNEKNAVALAKLLKGKGYDAFPLKGSVKEKGTVYRVLVGRFDDRTKSREMAAAIGEREKIKTVIFSE